MGKFDDKIHAIFFEIGVNVHKNRLYLLLLSLSIVIFTSFGFIWFTEQTTNDPQYVFSPANAPWRYERAVLTEHWPLDEEKFWPGKSYDLHGYVDVIAAGKVHPDYGRPNILNIRYLDEVARINDYIIHNLTVPVELNGKKYEIAYTDLCMRYDWACYLNDHITMLMPKKRWGNFSGPFADLASDIINTQVNITYPIGWRGTEPIYFGALVGAPNLVDSEGHFDYASAIRLTYNTREKKVDEYGVAWRIKLAEWLTNKENPVSELLEFGINHNMTLPEGLQDVADTLAPKFVGTCAILFTFSFIVSVVLRRHNGMIIIDWVRSKPYVAAAGLLTPILSTVTSFGLILWCGQLYNAIVNVSPFLILCIGIDDLFIMSAEWHRTNPKDSAEKRIGQTLSEAAVAISITSITDVTTFAVGCYTTLPGVQMFCLYTCVQCFFCYVYQIIFLGPILAYAAEMEQNDQHALLLRKAVDPEKTESKWKLWLLSGSVNRQNQDVHRRNSRKVTPEGEKSDKSKWDGLVEKLESTLEQHDNEPGHNQEETLVSKVFREIIGPFILQRSTQVCALLLYLVYISLAIGGCLNIKEGLDPKLLVREEFYLHKFYEIIDETFWREGLQMQVVVSNPPDLFNPESRKRFDDMMSDFENTAYTMKANATMIWVRAFEHHLNNELHELNIQKPNSSSEWYHRCRDWLLIAGGRRLWQMDMEWDNNTSFLETPKLNAFRFQLGLRNYRTPTDHTNSCKLMRSISAKYPELNVTTFHEYYPFADQYLELKPSLIQNMSLDLITILMVSLVMIPEWKCAVSIVLSIASINVGVLGFMSYWGVNLDSVSIITVIMCIGFAVDLSAHISYAFSQSYGNSHQRAVAALETLGWPVFLGASATVLGILLLTLVDAYIVQIFFKTVFLVIIFSMLHGLIFLPILLMLLVRDTRNHEDKTTNQLEMQTTA